MTTPARALSIGQDLDGIDIRTDHDSLAVHGVDWTGRFRGSPAAVAFPASTEQVVQVVEWCRRNEFPVVPQGGNTGLVGGATAPRGGVIVNTRRLQDLDPVDLQNWSVEVGAGVTLDRLQAHAAATGVRFAVDFGSRGSATVGGAIATNAGGPHVVRHGPMRHQLLGIEAVLSDGRVLRRMKSLRKDNTGLDLAGLMCGSEGTLGVITRAQLRVVPACRQTATAMLGLQELSAVPPALHHLRSHLPGLEAVELILGDTIAEVCRVLHLPHPVPETAAAYLLVEVGSAGTEPLRDLLEAVSTTPGLVDATADEGEAASRRLWAYRDNLSEVMSRLSATPVVKLDVAIPCEHLAQFIPHVQHVASELGVRAHIFGHAGDGNVHINVLDAGHPEDIEVRVLADVLLFGGSISAEHGIGVAKVDWLATDRTPDEISAMWDVKAALDPGGFMNPGVLLPTPEVDPPHGGGA